MPSNAKYQIELMLDSSGLPGLLRDLADRVESGRLEMETLGVDLEASDKLVLSLRRARDLSKLLLKLRVKSSASPFDPAKGRGGNAFPNSQTS